MPEWYQYDSLMIWARTMSSSTPHLHAAHWMIWSVVPAKSPSTRLKLGQSLRVLALARLPRLLLAVAFSGRISTAGRTRAAHCAPVGSAAPTGNVTNLPDGGTVVVVVGAVVVVVGGRVVVVVGA